MHAVLHVKYPLFLSDFNETRNFLDRFLKDNEISKIMKIRRVGAELFQGGRTERRMERREESY